MAVDQHFIPPDQHMISMCWHPWAAHAAQLSDSGHAGTASTWPLANAAHYFRFIVQRPTIAYKLFTANGAVSGNLDLGIYDEGGSSIITLGSTAMAGGTDLQLFDITDTTLLPGRYWFGMSVDNTTASFYRNQDSTTQAAMLVGWRRQTTAHPLPSTANLADFNGTIYVPNVGIVARTVDP